MLPLSCADGAPVLHGSGGLGGTGGARPGRVGRLRIVGAIFAWVAAILIGIANVVIVCRAVHTGAASERQDLQLVLSKIGVLLSALDWDVLCNGLFLAFVGAGLLLSFRLVVVRAIGLAYMFIGASAAGAGGCSLAHHLSQGTALAVGRWVDHAAIGIPVVALVGLLVVAIRQRLAAR